MIFWSGTRQELIWRKTMVTTAVRLEPPNISGRWSMSHYQGLQLNIEYLTWYLWLCICFCNGVVRLCIVYLLLCIWYFSILYLDFYIWCWPFLCPVFIFIHLLEIYLRSEVSLSQGWLNRWSQRGFLLFKFSHVLHLSSLDYSISIR